MRLAIVASHPIQYQAPLFRELASRLDLVVFFACRATPGDQADAGFGVSFEWDVDLTSGFSSRQLQNVSKTPGPSHFSGCDTPSLGQSIHDGQFDAVLVLGWYLKSFWQAIFAAKRAGIPLLVRGDSQLETPRGLAKKVAKELIYRPGLRLFDAALFVGAKSRDYYLHYGYPEARLYFSPHCVDTSWFTARATPAARTELRQRLKVGDETKLALFAGKLIALKRPMDVVAATAMARAAGSNVELVIAGAGPLELEVRASARQHGVPLHELGFCNQSEMPSAYAASDVLVLPSDHETWGLVANEALASGIPIIVSDACGCAVDLASDGVVGHTFPRGDVDALARKLITVLNSPPSKADLSRKSAAYSIAAACDGIEAALRALVKVRAPQRKASP